MASYSHTIGLFAIMFAALLIPSLLSGHGEHAVPAITVRQTPHNLFPGYLESLAFDWGILYYVYVGVRSRNVGLLELSGGRWSSGAQLFRDIAIALPFWALWEVVATVVSRLLAQSQPPATDGWIVPGGPYEVGLWFITSISAGFCEEIIFRGYLQRQFAALTRSVPAAILAQAIAFGLIHPRGWRAVVTIGILGCLYGVLAAWRRDLKPNMIAHAMSDVWEGWLKHVLRLG